MARRKSRLTVADIGRLPLVKMPDQPRPSLKRFQQEEAREEEAARIAAERRRTAPLREAERELREVAREASARIAMYWRIPIEEIQMNPVSITRVDIAGDYEIGPRDEPAENAAWKEFQENLKSSGSRLSDAGLLRLSHYLSSLNYHRGISLTSVSNFATALERLVSLDVFQPGELTGYQTPAPTPTPTPTPTRHTVIDPLAEIESLNLDSREENTKAKTLCEASYFDERQPMVRAWFDSLRKFGIVVTQEDAKRCKSWFERNNKSFLNPRHFEECRRWNAKAGYWKDALTSVERVNDEIENLETSRLTVHQRNELNRRVQAAREADAQRFGK
jgi:hypothetical protein